MDLMGRMGSVEKGVIRVTQGRLDNQGIPDITDLQGLKVASVDRQAFLGCLASLVHVGKVDQRD